MSAVNSMCQHSEPCWLRNSDNAPELTMLIWMTSPMVRTVSVTRVSLVEVGLKWEEITMKKAATILALSATLVLTLAVFFNTTGRAEAATDYLTGVVVTSDSVDRIWMSFNSPNDHGAYWFYEYSLPGVGFRGYLSRTQDIQMLNMTAVHYEGYLDSYNVRNIPIPVLNRHQPASVDQ